MKKELVMAIALAIVTAAGPAAAEMLQPLGYGCTAADGGACRYHFYGLWLEAYTFDDGWTAETHIGFSAFDADVGMGAVTDVVEFVTLQTPSGDVIEYDPEYYSEAKAVWQWTDNGDFVFDISEAEKKAIMESEFECVLPDPWYPEGDYTLTVTMVNGDVAFMPFHLPQLLSLNPSALYWPPVENLVVDMSPEGAIEMSWDVDPGYASLPQPSTDPNDPNEDVTARTRVRWEAYEADETPRNVEFRFIVLGTLNNTRSMNSRMTNYLWNLGARYFRLKVDMFSEEGNRCRTQQDFALIKDENGFNLIPTTIDPEHGNGCGNNGRNNHHRHSYNHNGR